MCYLVGCERDVWTPVRGLAGVTRTPLPELQTVCPGAGTHQDLHRFSVEQPGQFWAALARARLTWDQDWITDMDCSFHQGRFSWFSGGKLNVSVNCVDRLGRVNLFSAFIGVVRWAAVEPGRVALVWEKDEPGQTEQVAPAAHYTYHYISRYVAGYLLPVTGASLSPGKLSCCCRSGQVSDTFIPRRSSVKYMRMQQR